MQGPPASPTGDAWTIVRKGARRERRGAHLPGASGLSYRRTGSRVRAEEHRGPSASSVRADAAALSRGAWWRYAGEAVRRACCEREVRRVLCLGMGSFEGSARARWQLAAAILLAGGRGAVVVDPGMTMGDVGLVGELGEGWRVVEPGAEDTDVGEGCVLLFMPHCGRALYDDVLTRFGESALGSIVLLGNSFGYYSELDGKSPSKTSTSIVERLCAEGRVVEVPCGDACGTPMEQAFNDLSVTTFTHT